MLRQLVHGLADRHLDLPRTATRTPALAASVSVLAHADRHRAVDALGLALWATAIGSVTLAVVIGVALTLGALLAALPAHPALLVAGVAVGYVLAASLPLAVVWTGRRLLTAVETVE